MLHKLFSLFSSTKVALVLLVLISLSCAVGASLPRNVSKEIIFSSLWFNFLLVLLIVNIVFCITRRTRILRLSQAGTTIFHLGLVALCVGVVYDKLFYFEGSIRLTEGETLSCAERASYDRVKRGRFFQTQKLQELGEVYFHKLHTPYVEDGKERGVANEIAIGDDAQKGRKRIIYVTRPFKYKGFEFYRNNSDGYSPLFVLRNMHGRVLYGAFAPLQSIKQADGTYLYRSGSAALHGSFDFPQDPRLPAVFKVQTVYHPDKIKKTAGAVTFQLWKAETHGQESSEEVFNGKAAFGERVKAGNYFLSMDEVRYWTSMNVVYRPGLGLIFGSFWITLGGLVLNIILKTASPLRKNEFADTSQKAAGISGEAF